MSDLSGRAIAGTILIAALLFAVTFTLGWTTGMANPGVGEKVLTLFKDQVASEIMDTDPFILAGKLFLNNLEVCVILFVGGASLGIVTLFILGLNGIAIGIIMELVSRTKSVPFMLAAILPHGIFEIPSFLISAGLGIVLAQTLLNEYHSVPDTDSATVMQALAKKFLIYVVPLVAIAACVEAFITPQIIQMVV
ncbi:MAG: stage II sporulation protein M [Methanoregulaceae archaeon]